METGTELLIIKKAEQEGRTYMSQSCAYGWMGWNSRYVVEWSWEPATHVRIGTRRSPRLPISQARSPTQAHCVYKQKPNSKDHTVL
jgi:hypothetical protein